MYTVVYLLDNKKRDLAAACLIRLHLEKLGIRCELEPLESYRAILDVYRPDMVIINHLTASHLVRYSQRLNDLGVLVAVLPNEGISYDESDLMFIAGKSHSTAHIDLFFAWNQVHRKALLSVGFGSNPQIEVVGPPRFDFYYEPWAKLFSLSESNKTRPKILVCTNFVFAKFAELPPEECDKFFATWKIHIEKYSDYWGAVHVNHRNRERLFSFLKALVENDEFDIVLRVHPSEDVEWYRKKLKLLLGAVSAQIELDSNTNITQLILNCDVEISMDSCTTALESWIARKPTIELDLERHEMLSNPLLDPLNQRCLKPSDIVEQVKEALAQPDQHEFRDLRHAHLANWCARPKGDSALRIAETIEEVLKQRVKTPSFNLNFADRRRGLKLKLLRLLGKPYNWQPQMLLRALYDSEGTYVKRKAVEKSITPLDVSRQISELRQLLY